MPPSTILTTITTAPTFSYSNNCNGYLVPKTCSSAGGDWTMRYSDSLNTVVNCGGRGKFDLVPWRQQKSRIDLLHAIGWERSDDHDVMSDGEMQQQLVAASTTQRRRRSVVVARRKSTKQQRRNIKIRIVFSFEFNRKMKIVHRRRRTVPAWQPNRNSRIDMVSHQQQQKQMFVLDPKNFQLSDRWQGYFSKRPSVAATAIVQSEVDGNGLVERLTDSCVAAADHLDYRLAFPKISEIFYRNNSDSDVFKQVPCAQCRYI